MLSAKRVRVFRDEAVGHFIFVGFEQGQDAGCVIVGGSGRIFLVGSCLEAVVGARVVVQ